MLEQLKDFSQKVEDYRTVITNESQTRTVLIEPFLKILGYDVANPFEVIHEYTCDIGTKKGEKVDYAIQIDDQVVFIIEAKDCNVKLTDKTVSQLYRYYGTTNCRIAILTNGVDYWFFSDTKRQNVMDTDPFYKFNILDYTEEDLVFLEKITRDNFDLNKIHNISRTYSFRKTFKDYLYSQVKSPSNEFTSFIMKSLGMSSFNSTDAPKLIAYELGNLLGVDGLEEPEIAPIKASRKGTQSKKLTGVFTLEDLLNTSKGVMGKPAHMVVSGEDFEVSTWSEVLVTLVEYAYKKTNDLEGVLILDDVKEDNKGWVAMSSEHMNSPKPITVGDITFYVNTHASSKSIVRRIKRVIEFIGIELTDVEFILE